jgi:hypothetical protein
MSARPRYHVPVLPGPPQSGKVCRSMHHVGSTAGHQHMMPSQHLAAFKVRGPNTFPAALL